MAQSSSVFITATEARQNPLRERTVHDEVRGIESAILDAVKIGLFEATVGDGTPMTNSSERPIGVWTVDTETDVLNVPNHGFSTGDAVTLSSTISLPAPLKSNAYYYVIYVDPDHIKLAPTYMDAVSGRPMSIDVTAGLTDILVDQEGDGYIQPPSVTISGGNPTSQGSARAQLASWGGIISIANTTGGSGYIDKPIVQIEPKGAGAVAGTITYTIVGITINDPGTDYSIGDILTVTGGSGTPATAVVTEINAIGSIQAIRLSNPGSYTTLPAMSNASTTVLPGGGMSATVNLTAGIRSISITNGGSGYTAPPRIIINDPSGVGAGALASLIGGSISSITITSPGYGYLGVSSVVFESGSGASAIASLSPSGVGGVRVTFDGNITYTDIPAVEINAVGSGAAAGTIKMKIISAQMTSPGIGYTVDDYLLISGGSTNENAYIRVTSVDPSGGIRSYTLESGGSYTELPGLISNPVNGGTGTLAGFNLTAGLRSVDVGTGGSGYTVPPIVTISPPASGGQQAVAYANISSGSVSSFTIVNRGSNYNAIPSITISNGSGATAEAFLLPTTISTINVSQSGSEYTYADVEIVGGNGSGATAVANLIGDRIQSIDLINPGSGYTSIPDVIITGNGIGAAAVASLSPTSIDAVIVLDSGSGYNTPPNVIIDGSATAVSTLLSTSIERIIVTDHGAGYTSDPTVYVAPGEHQTGTPISPILVPQRGYSISSISITSNGAGYESAPNVTIAPPQYESGETATATAFIGAGSGTFAIRKYPASRDYFKAWKSQQLSNEQLARPYIERMDTVVSYFTNMGYTINRLTNPATNATIMWKIQW